MECVLLNFATGSVMYSYDIIFFYHLFFIYLLHPTFPHPYSILALHSPPSNFYFFKPLHMINKTIERKQADFSSMSCGKSSG